ncbi:MAG: Mur ligase domain-containing protein, partial [Propionivibrio sp.]
MVIESAALAVPHASAHVSAAAILQQLAEFGVQPCGVADDSRQVGTGDLFLAYPGDSADGRAFIGDAIARGAVAVLWEAGNGLGDDLADDFVRSAEWP